MSAEIRISAEKSRFKLYEFGPTRAARCRWLLDELGQEYTSIDARKLMGTEEYAKIHPYHRVPALIDRGHALFESVAICTYLADQFPEKRMIAPPATWARALHDQWCYFALTEIEAYIWLNAKHTGIYHLSKRVNDILDPNLEEIVAAAAVFDDALKATDYLVENRFSVTDIVVSYTLNWARLWGTVDDFPNILKYLDRLYERPFCTLTKKEF